MNYLIIVIAISMLTLLLLYPFEINIYNNNNFLVINVSKLITLKLDLFLWLNSFNVDSVKFKNKNLKSIRKIKIKKINLKLQGLNFEYQLSGAYIGVLYFTFSLIKKISENKDIEFNYYINYYGEKSIEFDGVIRSNIMSVLINFIKA